MSSARCRAAQLPLRPLLCVAGAAAAAAAAAGVYYYIKKRGNGEKRAKLEDKHLTKDSVQSISLLDLAWMSNKATHSDSTIPEECEREQEGRGVLKTKCDQMTSTHCEELVQDLQAGALTHQTQVESHDHLQHDIHQLKCEMKKLQELVQMTERELSESCGKCEEIMAQRDQMTSTHTDQSLHAQEEKYEQELESTVQQENGNSDLLLQVEELKDTVGGLCNLIAKKIRKCKEAEKERSLLTAALQFNQSENKRWRRVLIQKFKSLQDSVEEANRKYELVASTNTQLEDQNFDLLAKVNILQQQLSDTGRRLNQAECELNRKARDLEKLDSQWKLFSETVLKDYEVECLAHTALRGQYTEMKEQCDKLLEEVQEVEQK